MQLDVLRAIAVVMVVASHIGPPPLGFNVMTVAAATFFDNYGHLGVDLFFVLSGFLVSGLLFREFANTGTVDARRFLIRRGLKIYPAFYVFLVCTVLLRMQRGTVFSASELLHEALFIQNYGQGVWTHTWSLAVEEHFYLLLVCAVLLLLRVQPGRPFRDLGTAFLVVALAIMGLRYWTFKHLPYSNETHMFPTHLRLDALFFGVVLARSYHLDATFVDRARRARMWIFAASIAVLIVSQTLPSASSRYVLGYALVYLGFGGVVLASVCAPTEANGVLRVVGDRIARVGSFSYSIYLWHTAVFVFGSILIVKVFGKDFSYYGSFAFRMTASVVFGIVMAKLVEMPVLRFRDRLFPAKAVSPATSVRG